MNVSPEHLHLALNHLPFLGAAFATIPVLFGLFMRSRPAVLAGLAAAALAGWSTPLVMATGEAAYERYEESPSAHFLDPQVGAYLDTHEERAEAWSFVFYTSALLTTIGVVLAVRRERWVRPAAVIALVCCAASLAAGVWVAESGGKIRRPDFRIGQPVPAVETHERDDED